MKSKATPKIYDKYKTTSYNWFPNIPSHWKWVFLSQASREQCNKNTNNIEKNVLSLSYGNIIRKKNINSGLVPKEYTNYQIVDEGNIILRLTDLQNDHTSLRTGLVREKGIITSAYTCLKPFENPNYLQYLLHSYDTRKIFYGMGGGVRQSISFSDIRNIYVPLPPRPEQDQIVRYLDWKVAMINAYLKAKKKQIELLKEQKSQTISEIMLENIDEYVKIRHLSRKLLQYGANSSGVNYSADLPRYVRITDIGNDGLLKKDNMLSLVVSEQSQYLLNDGDVLFARSGATVGKSFLYKKEYGDCAFAGYLIRFVPDVNKLLPEYLYYFTLSNYYNYWLNQVFIQATIQNVSAEKYKDLKVPFVSIEKQQIKLAEIKAKIEPIDTLIAKVDAQITLLQEYRTRLISDVVTGRVDVRNVNVPEFERQNVTENSITMSEEDDDEAN
jgi:type I restriction enzyme S subunit